MKQKRSSPTRNNADNHSGKRDLYKIALLLREANKISQLLKKNMASITLLKNYKLMFFMIILNMNIHVKEECYTVVSFIFVVNFHGLSETDVR